MNTKETLDYKYWAFISYSSHDKKWARWLHRAIEGYGIPAQFLNHTTPLGHPAPKRLRPCFRDRDELAAAPELGKVIEVCLLRSRYLIVVCSPSAARSKWVNKEIETFQGFGRADRVLAVIVDGEPHAGGECECYPVAIRSHDPLAADARRSSDGKTNALLKVLAFMLGVNFDELKRRDNLMRVRRLQCIVLISLLISMAMVGLAWYASRQRDDAVRAREQAEEFLDFLVYDIQDDLRAVGRLHLAGKVLERVDKYHQSMGASVDERRRQFNAASATMNKADLLVSQRNYSDAIALYDKSILLLSALDASNPGDLHVSTTLASAYNTVASVLMKKHNVRKALNSLAQSSAVLDSIEKSSAADLKTQRVRIAQLMQLGVVLRADGDLAGSLKVCKEAVVMANGLADANISNDIYPVLCKDAVSSRLQLSDMYLVASRYDDARECLGSARGMIAVQHDRDPSDAEWQVLLAAINCRFGEYYCAIEGNSDLDEEKHNPQSSRAGLAAIYFAKAVEVQSRLVARDQNNAEWKSALIHYHLLAGNALRIQHDLDGAEDEYSKASDLVRLLKQADPKNPWWTWQDAEVQDCIGDLAFMRDDSDYGKILRMSSMRSREVCVNADPANVSWRLGLCDSYMKLSQGAGRLAREARRMLHEMSAQYPKRGDIRERYMQCTYMIGECLELDSKHEDALKEYQEGLRAARLPSSELEAVRDMRPAFYEKCGDMMSKLGDYDGAIQHYLGALVFTRGDEVSRWSDSYNYGERSRLYQLMGGVEEARGAAGEALKHYVEALECAERAASAAKGGVAELRDLLWAHDHIARFYQRRGTRVEALYHANEALRVANHAAAMQPDNALVKNDVESCRNYVDELSVP